VPEAPTETLGLKAGAGLTHNSKAGGLLASRPTPQNIFLPRLIKCPSPL
jgi:hypothetical protein